MEGSQRGRVDHRGVLARNYKTRWVVGRQRYFLAQYRAIKYGLALKTLIVVIYLLYI